MTHPVITDVTARIVERSAEHRSGYLQRLAVAAESGPARGRLACANLVHGFAASDTRDKDALRPMVKPNIAIVSSYNDMLSAHKPFESYPARLKQAVLGVGGIAQFAGGVPAMCDGITQGRDGMQLSLFSRDVIAMATAIALSYDMFDGALLLGVCDKIVPGILIGALGFGHLPAIFVPAAGGAPYLRAIHSPVPAARFCPTGGITPTNMAEYLKAPNVGCVGGSWLTPTDAVGSRDWPRIASLAAVVRELADPTMRKPNNL